MGSADSHPPGRRWAFLIVCLGTLLVTLDATIVNVALPSIRDRLGLAQTSLAWVVNAYLLTFGGFLLLGGRLGDFLGHRRVFSLGTALFTLASLFCGLTTSLLTLIGARAIQGLGGALVSAAGLSLITGLFTTPRERAQALGAFGLVSSGGGSVGLLLGGLLTSSLDWHWIFLINVPVGIAVWLLCPLLLPVVNKHAATGQLDVAGALAITTALMLGNYGIISASDIGWHSWKTCAPLAGAAGILGLFIYIETCAHHPLLPLNFLWRRNLLVVNFTGAVWASVLYAWSVVSTLYLQQIVGYTPLQMALAFLPASAIVAVFSLGISANLVLRFGVKIPLAFGLMLTAAGVALFARSTTTGTGVMDVLPSMLLVALGIGAASNALLLAAVAGLAPQESGLGSGLVSTSFSMGGALGLAILVGIASARTKNLLACGASVPFALSSGYRLACTTSAVLTTVAFFATVLLLPGRTGRPGEEESVTAAPDTPF